MTEKEIYKYIKRLSKTVHVEINAISNEMNEKNVDGSIFAAILLSYYASFTQNLVNYIFDGSELDDKYEVFTTLMRQIREEVGGRILEQQEFEERTKGYH